MDNENWNIKSNLMTKNSTKFKKIKASYSRKNTQVDEEDEDIKRDKKNFNSKNKNEDQFQSIFSNPINANFYSSKKEINIFNEEEYYLDFNEKEDVRKKYYSKLIYKNIWAPGTKNKKFNSLFIYDWDDTLFPTSFLVDGGLLNENNLSEELIKLFSILEEIIVNILTFSIEKGDVCIITNSSMGWFKYSSDKYYPNLGYLLEKIKIISARDAYEEIYPGQNKFWKSKAFLDFGKEINKNNLVTNMICLGDSLIELDAAKTLASQLNESFVKTIKFKENPEIEDLIKQLILINNKINYIYSKPKNLSITIEQKY